MPVRSTTLCESAVNDTLHVLPLRIVPLKTAALKHARLTKNTRLEGVIELFSGRDTGSGQIYARDLKQSFDFSGERQKDYDVVMTLSELPSYDVYSLRLELRALGIAVDEDRHLRLSEEMVRQLSVEMLEFTRPLIAAVFGKDFENQYSFVRMIEILQDPNVPQARANLCSLAAMLEVELQAIPEFLMRYGDIFLSLAYYSYCMGQIQPTLQDFLRTVDELLDDSKRQFERTLLDACTLVKNRLVATEIEVLYVLDSFKLHTESMWDGISASRFRAMEKLILQYQRAIGGSICALTMKMIGWSELKGRRDASSLSNFILSDMVHGLDHLHPIDFRGKGSKDLLDDLIKRTPADNITTMPFQTTYS